MAFPGIDASRHQGVIDWAQVAASGKVYAFIKATDGIAYKYVNWFHQNAPQVQAAGLLLGAYHFLLDHHPGDAQARYFVQEVNRSVGFDGVVPIVDIEREADGTTPRIEHLRSFVAEFRRLVPGRPILIYTGRWYWVGLIGNPYGADLGPLWHSEYDGIDPIDFDVANGPELDVYGGWSECLIWQHTSSGFCPGIGGSCDLNLFYGSHADLLALAGVNLEEDTLSATEVEAIKAHVTAEANRVINEIYRSLPFFAHDYDTDNDDMWVVNPATRQKWLVPQPGETAEEQEFPGEAFLADGIFGQVVLGADGVYHISTHPNGYPKAWHRSEAHLDLYETVGPTPPGADDPAPPSDG
jgi:GH25 family lysozyme M1 (1,4-beta-N-acetylmuramidase)